MTALSLEATFSLCDSSHSVSQRKEILMAIFVLLHSQANIHHDMSDGKINTEDFFISVSLITIRSRDLSNLDNKILENKTADVSAGNE